jgi:serine/threonine-protein kinase SRPK3
MIQFTPLNHCIRANIPHLVDEIEDDSEDEGIEDYKIGGYHPIHVG